MTKILATTSATRQVRQQWFSGCIFPLRLLFGLTGNRPQSAPACSFLRCSQYFCRHLKHFRFVPIFQSGQFRQIFESFSFSQVFRDFGFGQFDRFLRFDRFEPFERFLKIWFLGRFGLTNFRFLRVNFDQNVLFQLDTVLQLETLSRTQFAYSA